MIRRMSATIMMISCLVIGCSPKERDIGPRVATTPLYGTVEVDGEPAEGLTVECHPEPGSSEIKSPLFAMTQPDGSFSFGLYKKGGGVPAGNYTLAFKWEVFGRPQNDKDALKNAYADPKKSKFQVTVVEGEPKDLELIELSTKGPR